MAACWPSGLSEPAWGPCCPGLLPSPRTGRVEQLGCLAASERCSSQRVPPGFGCLEGYMPAAFNTLRGGLDFICSCWYEPEHRHHCPWLLGTPASSSSPSAASALAGAMGGGKEGAGLTQARQGRKQPRGSAGGGTACQEHLGGRGSACIRGCAARSSHPCVCRLGGTGGCLCPAPCASSAPAPRLLLAEPWSAPSPFKQVLGDQPPPLAFAEGVRDACFPTTTREGGDLVWVAVASSRTIRGGSGVPCTLVFTRKPGRGGGTEGGEISAAKVQLWLLPYIAPVTAAGTQPLHPPLGLFCQSDPFPTPWQGQGASARWHQVPPARWAPKPEGLEIWHGGEGGSAALAPLPWQAGTGGLVSGDVSL